MQTSTYRIKHSNLYNLLGPISLNWLRIVCKAYNVLHTPLRAEGTSFTKSL